MRTKSQIRNKIRSTSNNIIIYKEIFILNTPDIRPDSVEIKITYNYQDEVEKQKKHHKQYASRVMFEH